MEDKTKKNIVGIGIGAISVGTIIFIISTRILKHIRKLEQEQEEKQNYHEYKENVQDYNKPVTRFPEYINHKPVKRFRVVQRNYGLMRLTRGITVPKRLNVIGKHEYENELEKDENRGFSHRFNVKTSF